MMLDATAGHRMMWPNKNPPNTVFMDKKHDTRIPPDVIGVWEHLPFKDDCFDVVLFDPPHLIRFGKPGQNFRMFDNYGCWSSKVEALVAINKAQAEFARVAGRLCFKWCDTRDGPKYWGLLPLFKGRWRKVFERSHPTKGSGHRRTYWATFVRRGEHDS